MIVDTNVAAECCRQPASEIYAPVLRAIYQRRIVLIYGGKLKDELSRVEGFRKLIMGLSAAGLAFDPGDEIVAAEERVVVQLGLCRSNDSHVIALARVSGARVLCTQDGPLTRDFKDKRLIASPPGRVYQKASHDGLLRRAGACARKPTSK